MKLILLSAITSFFCYFAITHQVKAKEKKKAEEEKEEK
jgi:hypothetical protein